MSEWCATKYSLLSTNCNHSDISLLKYKISKLTHVIQLGLVVMMAGML